MTIIWFINDILWCKLWWWIFVSYNIFRSRNTHTVQKWPLHFLSLLIGYYRQFELFDFEPILPMKWIHFEKFMQTKWVTGKIATKYSNELHTKYQKKKSRRTKSDKKRREGWCERKERQIMSYNKWEWPQMSSSMPIYWTFRNKILTIYIMRTWSVLDSYCRDTATTLSIKSILCLSMKKFSMLWSNIERNGKTSGSLVSNNRQRTSVHDNIKSTIHKLFSKIK